MPEHRFLVGLPQGDGAVSLAWRLLPSDAPDAAFHVERDGQRVTTQPITGSTTYIDLSAAGGMQRYRVRAVGGSASEEITVDPDAEKTKLARDIPLDNTIEAVPGLIVGDLSNDGKLGYVLRAVRGGQVWIIAYHHDGHLLWEQNTNLPAAGGWDGSTLHVPLLCWDVNADGRTEVVYHSHVGRYPHAIHGEPSDGSRLTAVDGATGEPVWEAPWPSVQPRVMMTVGHLNGLDRPASIVVQDETYRNVVLTAVNGATAETDWRVEQERAGGHNLDIADIDGDGVQEVICGGVCYNGNGTVRWEAEPFGHTDISKPGRIVPGMDGLQIWYAVENNNTGVYLVDQHGETLWKEPFRHAHYGWLARHAPGVSGLHPHTAEDGRHEYGAVDAGMRESGHFPIYLPDGSHWLNLTDWERKNFVPVHWDGGPEVVFIVRKENKRVVTLAADGDVTDLRDGDLPEGGVYERNLACVDVLGDYRENIVTVDMSRKALIVLANPTPNSRRGYSPWDDFEYRHDRSQLGSGYYIYISPPSTILE